VPPLGGDAASAEERPFIRRKELGCRGDAAPKAEIPLLQRKGRATLGNKALCRLLTEDVVPPPERRHAAPLGKYFLPTFWEVVTPLVIRAPQKSPEGSGPRPSPRHLQSPAFCSLIRDSSLWATTHLCELRLISLSHDSSLWATTHLCELRLICLDLPYLSAVCRSVCPSYYLWPAVPQLGFSSRT